MEYYITSIRTLAVKLTITSFKNIYLDYNVRLNPTEKQGGLVSPLFNLKSFAKDFLGMKGTFWCFLFVFFLNWDHLVKVWGHQAVLLISSGAKTVLIQCLLHTNSKESW